MDPYSEEQTAFVVCFRNQGILNFDVTTAFNTQFHANRSTNEISSVWNRCCKDISHYHEVAIKYSWYDDFLSSRLPQVPVPRRYFGVWSDEQRSYLLWEHKRNARFDKTVEKLNNMFDLGKRRGFFTQEIHRLDKEENQAIKEKLLKDAEGFPWYERDPLPGEPDWESFDRAQRIREAEKNKALHDGGKAVWLNADHGYLEDWQTPQSPQPKGRRTLLNNGTADRPIKIEDYSDDDHPLYRNTPPEPIEASPSKPPLRAAPPTRTPRRPPTSSKTPHDQTRVLHDTPRKSSLATSQRSQSPRQERDGEYDSHDRDAGELRKMYRARRTPPFARAPSSSPPPPPPSSSLPVVSDGAGEVDQGEGLHRVGGVGGVGGVGKSGTGRRARPYDGSAAKKRGSDGNGSSGLSGAGGAD